MSGWPAAAFLDRDGTINVKAPEGSYIVSPAAVRLLDGAARGIARLNEAGVAVFVVTNQRGIALGRMTDADLESVHARLDELLAGEGAHVDGWYHCPHDTASCDCRKPGTAMLERAAAEHGIGTLDRTVIVGDSASDIEAGRRVGAASVLLRPSPEAAGTADAVRASLADAVEWILAQPALSGGRRG